jgi:hypothetical protein
MIRRKGRLPPYVQGFEDRHGAPRHYFRRHGRRTPLPGKPWSPGFMTAHAVALAASEVAPTDRTTADRPNPRRGCAAMLRCGFAGLIRGGSRPNKWDRVDVKAIANCWAMSGGIGVLSRTGVRFGLQFQVALAAKRN